MFHWALYTLLQYFVLAQYATLSLKKLIIFIHILSTYILFIFFDKFLVQQIMIHYTKILLDWAEEYFQHRQNNDI